jgi:hypothetical protein
MVQVMYIDRGILSNAYVSGMRSGKLAKLPMMLTF